MHVFQLSSNFCLALFSATQRYITASANCKSFPLYGRPLHRLTTIYELCRALNREDPHRMRQLELDIAELTGLPARASSSSTQCSISPARPLRCPDSRRPLSSNCTPIGPAPLLSLLATLVLQCHDGPVAVRHVDELLETAEGDVSCRYRGRPLVAPLCAQRLDSSTHLGLWNLYTRIGKALVILQSPTSSPMNA